MKIIDRICSNCIWKQRQECIGKTKICRKWVYFKANCRLCVFLDDCFGLGKTVSESTVCVNFEKSVNSPKNLKNYETFLPEEEAEFSPVELVENIISSNYDSRVFQLVDDRDIPKATNPVRFIISKKGLNISLFPMQLKIFLELFSAYCPYCSNTKYIKSIVVDTPLSEILDRVVFYTDGVCKKCGKSKYDAVKDGKHKFYDQLIGVAGQRSSKSTSVGILSATVLHQFLKLPKNPVEYFNLLPNSTLHATFVGLRYNDAFDNLWEPFNNLIKSSPWYIQYHAFLEEEGDRIGSELLKARDTFLAYKWKNIGIYPSGPDKRTLRGRTRIISSLDELGWFMGSEGSAKFDADEVYNALDNSLMTVQSAARRMLKKNPSVPTAWGMYISSPSSKTDKAMRLYKQSLTSNRMYGFKMATWEFNPNITRQDLNAKFMEDPITAERDFGANPPFSVLPYIKGPSALVNIFSGKKNIFKHHGNKIIRGSLNEELLYPKISFVNKHTYPSVLSIDAGYNCLSGNTLIPTEKGLCKLGSLVELPSDAKPGYKKRIDLKVGSSINPKIAEFWHYKGESNTSIVETKSGHYLVGTEDHPVLILKNNEHVWVKLKDINVGDPVCLNLRKFTSDTAFKLNLKERFSTLPSNNTSQKKLPKVPDYMTPELAYIIGALISGGHYGKYYTVISNSNILYLKKIRNFFEIVFGIKKSECGIKKFKKGEYKINGIKGNANFDSYSISYGFVMLYSVWKDLGLVGDEDCKNKSNKPSYYKFIPDCIMQADSKSQASFMAAYIEGDGSIRSDRYEISVWSSSKRILWDFQILLNTHGIMSNNFKHGIRTASATEAYKLYNILKPYLSFKHTNLYLEKSNKVSNRWGFDSSYVREFLKSRYIRWAGNRGDVYKNDKGEEIYVTKVNSSLDKKFCYEIYHNEGYDHFLSELKRISKIEYSKLKYLLDCEYWYSPIVSIKKDKKRKVYDLTMEAGVEPAFIANGMVVHNSNSFALSLSHIEMREKKKVFVTSGVIEIIPRPCPISFVKTYDKVIAPIIEAFNVKIIAVDRWQSIDLSQRVFDDFGIDGLIYSVKYSDFEEMKGSIYSEDVLYPEIESDLQDLIELDTELNTLIYMKPINHLFLQCLMTRDTGRMVTKGEEVTDDILRTIVLGYAVLNMEEYEHLFNTEGVYDKFINLSSIITTKTIQQQKDYNSSWLQKIKNSVPGIGVFKNRRG